MKRRSKGQRNLKKTLQNKNIIGLFLCAIMFIIGFLWRGNVGLYFNLAGLFIVVGGSFGAALISYRYERLLIIAKVVISSYRTKPKEPREIVGILVDLAVKSRVEGILSLERDEREASMLFLREALGVLVDGYTAADIRNYLSGEMSFFRLRRENCEQTLRNIADYFPSFGLIGSVVGLIGMLTGVGDYRIVIATVPIALTSTLYGIILANLFFLPFAANVRERTNKELLLQKIIMEGVMAIESELNPRLLEKKLKSFLTPSSRTGDMVSLQKIRERFKIKESQQQRKGR